MIGLIKGLLGSKKTEDAVAPSEATSAPAQKPSAYFLEPDDAKTFGDIEFMRTAKTVKRSFPKTPGNGGGFKVVQQVSSMEALDLAEKKASAPAPTLETVQPVVPAVSAEVEERRSVDTSMDLFRKMARDIKK